MKKESNKTIAERELYAAESSIDEIVRIVEPLTDRYERMSEKTQESDKGYTLQEKINCLEEAIQGFETARDYLYSFIDLEE